MVICVLALIATTPVERLPWPIVLTLPDTGFGAWKPELLEQAKFLFSSWSKVAAGLPE